MNNILTQKVKNLPHRPGVYKFLNAKNEVIYVGKAKSLASRVGQYFQKNLHDGKTKQLVENVADLEIIEVFSELEALILEAELIKKYRPKYNINLKDDKSYLYIVIRSEGEFKKVFTARKGDIAAKDISFGPFPNGQTAKYVLRAVRRLFPFRDCSESKFKKHQKLGSPCLFGHIKLCPAPCVNKEIKTQYQRNIMRLKRFLQGKQAQVILDLQRKMNYHAKNQEYEKAQEIYNIIKKIEYVQQNFRVPREFMENPYLVDDVLETALKELVKYVPVIKDPPKRIECYDVANITGKDAAVSMVVAINGRLENRQYKKFKIRLKETPDDVFMLREALTRRFVRETQQGLKSWGLPDLVVVDGGKGQVSVALDVMEHLSLKIPVIGLAKKEEVIVYRDAQTTYKELRLDKSSEAIKLLQRLRDEAHRFARVYHHYLRSKSILGRLS